GVLIVHHEDGDAGERTRTGGTHGRPGLGVEVHAASRSTESLSRHEHDVLCRGARFFSLVYDLVSRVKSRRWPPRPRTSAPGARARTPPRPPEGPAASTPAPRAWRPDRRSGAAVRRRG